ncbi:integration host factor subunit beta [Roseiconus nitratireducens]|uniref:Integration host factor subunit beta n=1 Tax=Roseiconus nitratireducens TaxID=2605748 RepID=A0A5M6D4C1_9BACT|nr:HU family DNA-binding protein [Roseiconus nitratireducens]KAA5541430.1 integration host factor subunit beta [Roseiconus nitratireducens]
MTKKDIVRTISDEVGLTQQQTKKIVQLTFDSIIDTLVREGRIELRNFGVFEVKPRAARRARNPRTGDEVIVPEKHVVTFKPGKHMEAKVQDADLPGTSVLEQSGREPDADGPVADSRHASGNQLPPSTKITGRWDDD